MLQQTRAAAVVPYYERFVRRFTDVTSLAQASDRELLECWSGLGYYSRARNLREAARRIVFHRAGKFPKSYEEWLSLPGVGPYTAAAVASIAFGEPVAVLDGNVARVMARLTAHRGDVRASRVREELRDRAQDLLDRRHSGDFNQAMMELGATVCLPRNPHCLVCPISGHCAALRLGKQNELPVRLVRERTVREQIAVGLVERNGSLLLRQRPEDASLLPGFWELPQGPLNGPAGAPGQTLEALGLVGGERLGRFRHSITYHEYTVSVHRAKLRGRRPKGYQWIAKKDLAGLPLTTITKKALDRASEPRP